jgi:hypothetical protein
VSSPAPLFTHPQVPSAEQDLHNLPVRLGQAAVVHPNASPQALHLHRRRPQVRGAAAVVLTSSPCASSAACLLSNSSVDSSRHTR